MADYIKRKVVKELLNINYSDYLDAIDRIPAADVAPVMHGQWVFGGDGCVICSECNEEESNNNHRNYCPNCGARMDGYTNKEEGRGEQ